MVNRLTFRRPTLPLGFFGCLLAVAGIELHLKHHEMAISNVAAQNWKIANREARRQIQPGNILCFGTSLVKFGVVPRTIERETGLRAYNLGLVSGHMTSSYYMLARSLSAGARPAAIVVDNQDSPHDLDDHDDEWRTLRTNIREWPELLTPLELLDLAWQARDPQLFGQVGVSAVLTSYKARHEIRAHLLASLAGTPLETRAKMQQVREQWAYHRGVFLIRNTSDSTDLGTIPEFDREPNAASVNPRLMRSKLGVEYRERFLNLAASQGLRVYWVMPPLPRSRQRERDVQGITSMMTDEARDVVARYPNVVVIDARQSGFPDAAFHDVVHLNAAGAEMFTEDLARAIRVDLIGTTPPERWALVPPVDQARWSRLSAAGIEPIASDAQAPSTVRR